MSFSRSAASLRFSLAPKPEEATSGLSKWGKGRRGKGEEAEKGAFPIYVPSPFSCPDMGGGGGFFTPTSPFPIKVTVRPFLSPSKVGGRRKPPMCCSGRRLIWRRYGEDFLLFGESLARHATATVSAVLATSVPFPGRYEKGKGKTEILLALHNSPSKKNPSANYRPTVAPAHSPSLPSARGSPSAKASKRKRFFFRPLSSSSFFGNTSVYTRFLPPFHVRPQGRGGGMHPFNIMLPLLHPFPTNSVFSLGCTGTKATAIFPAGAFPD